MSAQPHDRAWAKEPEPVPDEYLATNPTEDDTSPRSAHSPLLPAQPRRILPIWIAAPYRLYASMRQPARGRRLWDPPTVLAAFRRLPPRPARHGLLAALVLLLIGGSGFPKLVLGMDWSSGTAATATDLAADPGLADAPLSAARPLIVNFAPPAQSHAAVEALLPATVSHGKQAGPHRVTTHDAAVGEAVGKIATHYGVSAQSVMLADDLAPSKLQVGQDLHIPSRPDVTHTVVPGDTKATITASYETAPGTIRFFTRNKAETGYAIQPGEERFVPDGKPSPGDVSSTSIEAETALLTPVATGLVKDDSTNLRAGPGTGYDKIVKLNQGDAVKLRQRYDAWFKVTGPDGTNGWVSSDLLTIADGVADQVLIAPNVPPAPTPSPEPTQASQPAAAPAAEQAPARPADTPAQAEPTPVPPPPPRPKPSKRWIWPADGDITSGFGYRDFRIGRFHNGIDIANSKGTPIVAARAGVVVEAGWCSGYGYCVKIDHGDGFLTEYGHMAWSPPVRAGQAVDAGDLIGYMGMTFDRSGGGYATGVHLHFTLKLNGSAVNPLRYLP